MATVSQDQVSLVQTCRTSWQFPCGVLNFSWPSHLGSFRTHSSPNFPQRYLAAQEPFEPRIDLYYVRTIWIHLRSSSGPESWLPRKGPGEGVFLFFFSGEEILITTKYLSQRQPSECQVSVVINIHYDRNSKNSPFSSGCLCFYLEHQRTSSSSSARLSVYTHTHTDSSHTPLAIRWSYDLVINTSAVTLTWCFPGCKKKNNRSCSPS